MKSAQWLEQMATSQGNYPDSLPESVWRTPELRYRLSLVGNGQGFLLTATPVGTQSQDNCGALTLDQAGQRGSQADVSSCWSK
jgi:type IV pilus assembly protein PilE